MIVDLGSELCVNVGFEGVCCLALYVCYLVSIDVCVCLLSCVFDLWLLVLSAHGIWGLVLNVGVVSVGFEYDLRSMSGEGSSL